MVGRFAPALALARADARRRWRTWLVVVLVVGALGGGLFAVLAGARRTSSAYDRLFDASAAPDVVVGPAPECPGESPDACREANARAMRAIGDRADVAGVAQARIYSGAFALGNDSTYQELCDTGSGEAALVAMTGESSGQPVEQPVVIAGRAADPTKIDEVVVGVAAHDTGAHVGNTLVAELGEFCPEEPSPPTTRIELHIVGEVADTLGLRPELGQYLRTMYVTPAFDEWARAREVPAMPVTFVKMVDRSSVLHGTAGLALQFEDATRREAIGRSVDPDTLVLLLVAGLGAALALLVVAPALARVECDLLRDAPKLRAMGFTRRELVALGLVHGVAVAVPAALLAALIAVALSPTMPVGDAAAFEPAPGISVDWAVLGLGALVLVLVVVAIGTVSAGASRNIASSAAEPTGVGSTLADRLRVPPVGRLGARFAFDAVAGRVASGAGRVVTTVIALAGVVGALTFTAGLAHLQSSPRLVGWNWDAMAFLDGSDPALVDVLRETPGVERLSVGTFFEPGSAGFSIGRHREPSWPMSLAGGPNAVPFTVIEGRTPTGDRELLVHPRLLDALGLAIGDTTTVQAADSLGGRSHEVTIVGTGVIPVDAQVFEVAAGMTFGQMKDLFGARAAQPLEPEIVVLDFAEGVDVDALSADLVAKGLTGDGGLIRADRSGFGSQLVAGLTIDSVDDVPRVLAGLAALLAAGVLAHLLVARRREWRRELALHRAIGFTRGGVRASVSLGGALVALLAAAIGVPLGVLVGRRAWLLYAESLGVKPEAAVPWGWLLAAGAATVVVAVACVLVAGALDRRPVAEALRAE